MKDIHFCLLVAVSLPWKCPIVLAWDWHSSPLVPGATNWHTLLVCHEPPARHTCYMCVAKNHISAPLPYLCERSRASLCLPMSLPFHSYMHKKYYTPATRQHYVHTYTQGKETHPDTIPETSKQSRSPKNHRMCINRCCRAGIHIYKQGFAHTHTYKCSHNHTNNSRKIVRYGIESLTKRCMSMILIIIKLVCYPLCESQPRKWHFRCSA